MAELLYDHREEASGIPSILRERGIAVAAEQLPVADYIVSDKVAIERKSAEDFVSSLKDGRLFSQAERIREQFKVAILVLEGEPRWKKPSVLGAKASLARHGISVFQVRDIEETATVIRLLHGQENKAGKELRRPKATRKLRGTDEIAEDALAALPGISTGKAQTLLQHFGSLRGVLCASAEELQEVEGIGKKTAESLHSTFSHNHGEVPW